MFKNMKIGVRLALGFGIVLILLIAIALLGINRLGMLNQSLNELAQDRYPKTVWANNIIDSLNISARSLRNALLLKDRTLIEAELKRALDTAPITAANMDRLAQTLNLPAGKEAFQRAKEAGQVYETLFQSLIEMIRQGREKEATAFLMNDMREAQSAYFAAMEELVLVQGKDMESTAQATDDAYDVALTLTIT